MQTLKPQDAKHKAWLYRVLSAIADDAVLASVLRFKGGTCAALLGILDRFSVDLDFDFLGRSGDIAQTRKLFEKIFASLGLVVKDKSRKGLQYFLRYEAGTGERNTLKIDATFPSVRANAYEPRRLEEIDRIFLCQTPETMFANKLVALTDRYAKNGSIAGRDVYDIHHFFENGMQYNDAVIQERTGRKAKEYFLDLVAFIDKKVPDSALDEDLNALLSYDRFRVLRKTLKVETLAFLRDEVNRLAKI